LAQAISRTRATIAMSIWSGLENWARRNENPRLAGSITMAGRPRKRGARGRHGGRVRGGRRDRHRRAHAGGVMLRGECENCGKPFTRSRSEGAGRFCSAGCAIAGNRKHSPRTCAREGCGRMFVPYDERSMYCSRECGGLARRDPDAIITCTCRGCGGLFQVYRSYVEWGSGKYCSRECHLLDRSPTGPEERLYGLLDEDPGPGQWIPQYEALPGRKWVADAAVPGRLLILQADGDFWHGKDPAARANPKVASNRRRDAAFDAAAESLGWRVLRLWESELRDSPGACEVLRTVL